MKLERNSPESIALNLMRFPLACLIVLLHTGVTCGSDDFAYYLCNYVSAPIVVCAVPCFFFMSGYLFFMDKENFSFDVYRRTLLKKVKGLLIPYLLWNLVAYFFMVFSSFMQNGHIFFRGGIMPWELHKIFWSVDSGIQGTSLLGYHYTILASPAAGVLWFVRDLMVMMVCAIFMHSIIKVIKWWIFPVIFLMNILKLGLPFAGLSLAAISFFYMGAFFSIHEINIFQWFARRSKIVFFAWPVLIVVRIIFKVNGISEPMGYNFIYLCSSIAFVFLLTYSHVQKDEHSGSSICRWGEASFFIYAFAHTWIIWLINKEPGYLLDSIPYVGYTLNYLFLFSIKIVESLFVYYAMKRFLPKTLSLLTGGR